MKKKYNTPQLEIININTNNTIAATSNIEFDDGPGLLDIRGKRDSWDYIWETNETNRDI